MALAYLLDENLRGPLWSAIQRHNVAGINPVDAIRVGDPPGPPLGSPDPELLRWSEREGRILVTIDWQSMPGHLADHLAAGHHSPGVFILRPRFSLPQLVFSLALTAHAEDPAALLDQVRYIP